MVDSKTSMGEKSIRSDDGRNGMKRERFELNVNAPKMGDSDLSHIARVRLRGMGLYLQTSYQLKRE